MTTMDSYERASADELLMHSTFFEKTCKSSELAEFVKQGKMAKDLAQEGQSAFKVDWRTKHNCKYFHHVSYIM